MLAAIIVGSNRELIHWVSAACAELGDLCVYKTLTSYPQPYELIKLMDVFNPEIVFLEVEAVETPCIMARQIRTSYPKSAIIGFVQQRDAERDAEVTAAGVNDIVTPPLQGPAFLQTVVRAVAAQSATVTDNIIAFQPGKAGAGATTIALHTAAYLAQDWRKKLLLVEGDFASGALAAQCNLEADAEHSIIKVLEDSQWLDDHKWNGLLWKIHGFDLLPMPAIKTEDSVSAWEYRRLLTFARTRYELILVDLPELPGAATEAVANQAKTIYVVTTPDKASLYLARRRIEELKGRGAPLDRLSVVLNRCWQRHPETQELIRPTEIEKYLEREVSIFLPQDDTCLNRTFADGQLISRQSEFAEAVYAVANMLAGGEPPPPPPPPAPEKKLSLGSFFRSKVLQQSSPR